MREPILDVRFYATERGREPVREFLLDLTVEDRRAVGTDLKTVQFGWPLGMPLVRKMGDGLWEVCSTIPDGICACCLRCVSSKWCCCTLL